eukprot:634678-Prymnesium_polylepis.1
MVRPLHRPRLAQGRLAQAARRAHAPYLAQGPRRSLRLASKQLRRPTPPRRHATRQPAQHSLQRRRRRRLTRRRCESGAGSGRGQHVSGGRRRLG